MKMNTWRCGVVGALVLLGFLFMQAIVNAEPANEPDPDSVVTDGIIYSMQKTNNVLYMAGAFTQAGRRTGSWVPVSTSTGVAEAQFPQVNGQTLCMVPDGQGGWFVGGKFTVVGGLQRSNLVHVLSDRTVDPFWNPAPNNSVRALALTNGILYIGGSFTNIATQVRRYVAAVDAASGALNAWNPNADSGVSSIVVYGTNVYLGGDFLNVAGTGRRHLAAVDPNVGNLRAWNPGTTGSSDYVQPMLISGGRLIIGGRFTAIGGQTRGNLASVDLASETVEAWNPNANSDVYTLALGGSSLFVGGVFSAVGSSNRTLVAEVDLTTGLATGWSPQIGTGLGFQVSALLVHSNQIFMGGFFNQVGGLLRPYAAMFDVGSSQPTAWNPKPNFLISTMAGAGNSVYVGGIFGAVGCVGRTNLAAYDLSAKVVTPWNPVADFGVYALAFASNAVYFGGEFTNVNGTFRRSVAAVDMTNGTLTSWAPNPDVGYVYSLATWSNRLYVGGTLRFTSLQRTNFFEFDLETGNMTAWDPQVRSLVRTMKLRGDTLFAGGLIATVSGVSRRGIVAFDLPTGTLTSWNPGFSSASVEDIAIEGNRLYVVGIIRNPTGFMRTNFCGLDADTAAVLPITANADNTIYGLATTSNRIYLSGNFNLLNGQSRKYMTAMDADTGQFLPWSPDPGGYYGQATEIYDNTLYIGGPFYFVSSVSVRSLAVFPLSAVGQPAINARTLQRLTNGNFAFQFSAPAAVQATVWGTTNLISWDSLQSVPVVGGAASFTDTDAAGRPLRFYRVSVP